MDLNTKIEKALNDNDYQMVMHKASGRFAGQLDRDTLKSCEMVALWQAIKNFDPNRGTKIFTYLYKCVFVECLKELKFKNKSRNARGKLHENISSKPSRAIDMFELLDEAKNDEERSMLQDRMANKTIAEMAETRGVSREIVRRRLKSLMTRIRKHHEEV